MYSIDMSSGGMIHIPSFIAFYLGFQAILSLFLKNLRCYNVGIIDGGDL
jgi:hypothetical protein